MNNIAAHKNATEKYGTTRNNYPLNYGVHRDVVVLKRTLTIRETIAARVITLFLFSPFSSLSTCKSKASSQPTRALRHIFYRGTHSGRYRAYCLLSRDLYAFAIFPSRDWTRQGVAGKIQVRGVIGRYALERERLYAARTTFVATFPAGQILFRARHGPLSRILLSPHIFRYKR